MTRGKNCSKISKLSIVSKTMINAGTRLAGAECSRDTGRQGQDLREIIAHVPQSVALFPGL